MINFELRFFSTLFHFSGSSSSVCRCCCVSNGCRFCWLCCCYCWWCCCRILFGLVMQCLAMPCFVYVRKMRSELNITMNANISFKLFINILLVENLWYERCAAFHMKIYVLWYVWLSFSFFCMYTGLDVCEFHFFVVGLC